MTPRPFALAGSTQGVGPLGAELAAYLGMDPTIAHETFPRHWLSGTQAMTNNLLVATYFTAIFDLAVTKIGAATSAALSATTLALVRMALCTVDQAGDLTVVARCASDLTLFAGANTEYERAFDATGGFPTSYQLVTGTRYACAYLINAASIAAGSLRACAGQSGVSVVPFVCASKSGQNADIPTAQITAMSNAGPGAIPWFRLVA